MAGTGKHADLLDVLQLQDPSRAHDGGHAEGLGRKNNNAERPAKVEASAHRRRRLTREELAPEARESIFRAAMHVVGNNGYAGTTIERITKTAGIAQGSFYLYFESRQALFDELLPHFGSQMLDFIRQRVTGSQDIFDKEERGFRAFVEYMIANPGFFRLLTEAKGAAPEAHSRHFEHVTKPYVNALRRGLKTADIMHFGDDELEVVAYMLMAAREYLYLRYFESDAGDAASLEAVVRTYMKFVRSGFGRDG
jgi:AcrR family transcriptional regulator